MIRRRLLIGASVLLPTTVLYSHSVVISGASMAPTLNAEGDVVLVDPRRFWRRDFAKGDIVIAHSPQNELVCKRIVATVCLLFFVIVIVAIVAVCFLSRRLCFPFQQGDVVFFDETNPRSVSGTTLLKVLVARLSVVCAMMRASHL